MKPRLLDLFCGAGGAAMGYHRAGFEVVGVDIKPQKHYPFEFHQADAMTYPLEGFDVIHASPPCQGYSTMRHIVTRKLGAKPYELLIGDIKSRLLDSGKSWVIENVIGAPLDGVKLCGLMFGRKIHRHRIFESNIFFLAPQHPDHTDDVFTPRKYGSRTNTLQRMRHSVRDVAIKEMDCQWIKGDEVSQAIPPAYTEFIGKQLMEHLK